METAVGVELMVEYLVGSLWNHVAPQVEKLEACHHGFTVGSRSSLAQARSVTVKETDQEG